MPRRPRGPLEPDLNKRTRKRLARRMRAVLAEETLSIGEIADRLQTEPEAIVVGLRQLRTQSRGKVRSTVRFGHVSWWWEPRVNAEDLITPALPLVSSGGELAEDESLASAAVDCDLVIPSGPDEQGADSSPEAPSLPANRPAKPPKEKPGKPSRRNRRKKGGKDEKKKRAAPAQNAENGNAEERKKKRKKRRSEGNGEATPQTIV